MSAPLPSIAAMRAANRACCQLEHYGEKHFGDCCYCANIRVLDAVTYRLRDLKSIVSDPEWNYGYSRDGEKMATLDALLAPARGEGEG